MNRFDIINHLIKKYDYKTYLEIGTEDGNCFTKISIDYKECVDPVQKYNGLTHRMTSDEFFKQNNKTFDIIFVDGLHTEEQCSVDIANSLKCLNENGTIVVHDCLPHCEEYTQLRWNGTVFKSIIDLRYNNPNLNIYVVDTDCGCGVIRRATIDRICYDAVPISLAKTYFYYNEHRDQLMNVISPQQFLES